jgi:hypothetical protein
MVPWGVGRRGPSATRPLVITSILSTGSVVVEELVAEAPCLMVEEQDTVFTRQP